MQKYEDVQTLLNLDGQKFWPNPKYWVKFDVRRVGATPQIPHGIKYSLTLHDRNNNRILGFDNAHVVKVKGRKCKKYTGRVVAWDHVHKLENVKSYEYESASQLLDDFWKAVDEIIL
jgi:hypothetical protein